jgi:hypothetical protein
MREARDAIEAGTWTDFRDRTLAETEPERS